MTLMSKDVERTVNGLRSLHEIWASLIQVGLATWLLERELGISCLESVAIAADKRPNRHVMATMLATMNGVKMLGLTATLATLLQNLRTKEIRAATRFRMMTVLTAVVAYIPLVVSPVVTFTIFVKNTNRTLDASRLFTLLSTLLLLSSPLSSLFQMVPILFGAFACLERIQEYVTAPPRFDHRSLDTLAISRSKNSIQLRNITRDVQVQKLEFSDTQEMLPVGANVRTETGQQSSNLISVRNGCFGWKTAEDPVLKAINLEIKRTNLTILVGPVASGKSTLLKAIIGETPVSTGSVHTGSESSSFCDQTPWLLNATLQKNILGFSDFDGPW
ncbi:MAG: hypothetical protein M1818_002886 [Claussenomyces sp. TS43310]|nr:MAG: hypothetical protein M1818_002886 [Claussenomyces sp. TS43310]